MCCVLTAGAGVMCSAGTGQRARNGVFAKLYRNNSPFQRREQRQRDICALRMQRCAVSTRLALGQRPGGPH